MELIPWAALGLVAVAAVAFAATSRRRRMARHPAPSFVFADLAGYTALTEERGDDAAARVAREFRRTIRGVARPITAWRLA